MKVMIVGAGKLGTKLSQALSNGEIEVTLMDTRAEVLERAKSHLDVFTVKANGVQVSLLKELKIWTYDLIIAVTSSDETNIVVSMLAKKLGCPKSVARIRNPEYAEQLNFIKNEMNIDQVINPELSTANEIERYVLGNYAFYSGEYAKGRVSMIDLNVSNMVSFVGKKIMELDNIEQLVIVAISRNGVILIPYGETVIEENDIIYVMGKKENVRTLVETYKSKANNKFVKKVMILGGGKIGYYLAKSLENQNVNVKIIESNIDRCVYLSEELNSSLIIHGDGTDINLLEEEDLANVDAFVAITGYDEENLLMSLRAKQLEVNKVIAKVSRQNYVNIIEKLGIDVAINPVNITASEILKYIRGGKVISVSLLLGGEAEVTEIKVAEELPVVGKRISKLGLPKGIIIGAILHKNKVVIPSGDTVIGAGDRLVIFSLLSEVSALEKYF
ncbi:MAG: Trk system potassium transporter TrkA [Bacillota bacterium]|nr:Trk system potassium transporter TrkA [Bacillota bacterium]